MYAVGGYTKSGTINNRANIYHDSLSCIVMALYENMYD